MNLDQGVTTLSEQGQASWLKQGLERPGGYRLPRQEFVGRTQALASEGPLKAPRPLGLSRNKNDFS